jgi:hypothetical protein
LSKSLKDGYDEQTQNPLPGWDNNDIMSRFLGSVLESDIANILGDERNHRIVP